MFQSFKAETDIHDPDQPRSHEISPLSNDMPLSVILLANAGWNVPGA